MLLLGRIVGDWIILVLSDVVVDIGVIEYKFVRGEIINYILYGL